MGWSSGPGTIGWKDLAFGLIGGTALIMYGVETLGRGLEQAAGPALRRLLKALTGSVWLAFLMGAGATALVQSSTAITVLTVGFVEAGLLDLPRAVGIIYGANIGTTITAQLMATGLTEWALPCLGVGVAIRLLARKPSSESLGRAVVGLGLLFLGLRILNSGVPVVKASPLARDVFAGLAGNPLRAVLAGMVTTTLVHSSAATVGLTMVLAQAGVLELTTAVALMLGDNIGTCVTAQMASIGRSVEARRTAWAHTLYNVAGVIATFAVLPAFVALVERTAPGIARQVANSHTIFNALSAAVFLPITGRYVEFLEWLVPAWRKR